MKKYYVLIFVLTPVLSFAQSPINLMESNQMEFGRAKQKEAEFIKSEKIKKIDNTIKIKTTKKGTIKFEDDFSDENYETVEYVGDLVRDQIALIKTQGYNTDRYVAVNLLDGDQKTMVGFPHILGEKIVCLQGQETDVKQVIEYWQYENGLLRKIKTYTFADEIYPTDIVWLNTNEIGVQASYGKFWKAVVEDK